MKKLFLLIPLIMLLAYQNSSAVILYGYGTGWQITKQSSGKFISGHFYFDVFGKPMSFKGYCEGYGYCATVTCGYLDIDAELFVNNPNQPPNSVETKAERSEETGNLLEGIQSNEIEQLPVTELQNEN